jgi:hypothetical protein
VPGLLLTDKSVGETLVFTPRASPAPPLKALVPFGGVGTTGGAVGIVALMLGVANDNTPRCCDWFAGNRHTVLTEGVDWRRRDDRCAKCLHRRRARGWVIDVTGRVSARARGNCTQGCGKSIMGLILLKVAPTTPRRWSAMCRRSSRIFDPGPVLASTPCGPAVLYSTRGCPRSAL